MTFLNIKKSKYLTKVNIKHTLKNRNSNCSFDNLEVVGDLTTLNFLTFLGKKKLIFLTTIISTLLKICKKKNFISLNR
jgi:hypothetical protein